MSSLGSTCMNCLENFRRSSDNKRVERYSLNKTIPNFKGMTVKNAVLQYLKWDSIDLTRLDDGCLCTACYALLVKLTKGRHMLEESQAAFQSRTKSPSVFAQPRPPTTTPRTLKRKLSQLTPVQTPRSVKRMSVTPRSTKKAPTGRKGYKGLAIKHINNGNYGTCFRLLMSKSDKAFNQITKAIGRLIQSEVHTFKGQGSLKNKILSLECLDTLSWSEMLDDVQETMPVVWVLVGNLLASSKQQFKLDINPECMGCKVPVLGILISMVFYSRFPASFKMFPSLVSTILFKHGNHHAVGIYIIN